MYRVIKKLFKLAVQLKIFNSVIYKMQPKKENSLTVMYIENGWSLHPRIFRLCLLKTKCIGVVK
jgi:hypothetical protein